MEDYRDLEKKTAEKEKAGTSSTSHRAVRWMTGGLVVAILLILGLGYGLYDLHQQSSESFQDLNDQLAEMQDTLPLFAEKIDAQQKVLTSLSSDWDVIQKRVGVTEKELEKARTLAENLRQEQSRSVESLSHQIVTKANVADLEQLKSQAIGRLDQVDEKLTGVKADVRRSLDELQETWSQLEDLGVKVTEQGEFIAVNQEGLEELRRRGEKDYVSFEAVKGEPFRVGDLAIELRDTNREKHRAKLRLFFDDKRIVRGRIATNQPLTLYIGKDRVPYEVVINDVEKGKIQGYVSIPSEASRTSQVAAFREQ